MKTRKLINFMSSFKAMLLASFLILLTFSACTTSSDDLQSDVLDADGTQDGTYEPDMEPDDDDGDDRPCGEWDAHGNCMDGGYPDYEPNYDMDNVCRNGGGEYYDWDKMACVYPGDDDVGDDYWEECDDHGNCWNSNGEEWYDAGKDMNDGGDYWEECDDHGNCWDSNGNEWYDPGKDMNADDDYWEECDDDGNCWDSNGHEWYDDGRDMNDDRDHDETCEETVRDVNNNELPDLNGDLDEIERIVDGFDQYSAFDDTAAEDQEWFSGWIDEIRDDLPSEVDTPVSCDEVDRWWDNVDDLWDSVDDFERNLMDGGVGITPQPTPGPNDDDHDDECYMDDDQREDLIDEIQKVLNEVSSYRSETGNYNSYDADELEKWMDDLVDHVEDLDGDIDCWKLEDIWGEINMGWNDVDDMWSNSSDDYPDPDQHEGEDDYYAHNDPYAYECIWMGRDINQMFDDVKKYDLPEMEKMLAMDNSDMDDYDREVIAEMKKLKKKLEKELEAKFVATQQYECYEVDYIWSLTGDFWYMSGNLNHNDPWGGGHNDNDYNEAEDLRSQIVWMVEDFDNFANAEYKQAFSGEDCPLASEVDDVADDLYDLADEFEDILDQYGQDSHEAQDFRDELYGNRNSHGKWNEAMMEMGWPHQTCSEASWFKDDVLSWDVPDLERVIEEEDFESDTKIILAAIIEKVKYVGNNPFDYLGEPCDYNSNRCEGPFEPGWREIDDLWDDFWETVDDNLDHYTHYEDEDEDWDRGIKQGVCQELTMMKNFFVSQVDLVTDETLVSEIMGLMDEGGQACREGDIEWAKDVMARLWTYEDRVSEYMDVDIDPMNFVVMELDGGDAKVKELEKRVARLEELVTGMETAMVTMMDQRGQEVMLKIAGLEADLNNKIDEKLAAVMDNMMRGHSGEKLEKMLGAQSRIVEGVGSVDETMKDLVGSLRQDAEAHMEEIYALALRRASDEVAAEMKAILVAFAEELQAQTTTEAKIAYLEANVGTILDQLKAYIDSDDNKKQMLDDGTLLCPEKFGAETDWDLGYLEEAMNNGYIKGSAADQEFGHNKCLSGNYTNVAEAITMISRVVAGGDDNVDSVGDSDLVGDASSFPDWAQKHYVNLYEIGVDLDGLNPGDNINRIKMVSLVVQAMFDGAEVGDIAEMKELFPDVGDLNEQQLEELWVLVNYDVISGTGEGKAAPWEPLTRGAFAKIMTVAAGTQVYL
jgi:hypothetical protein